MLLSIIIVNYNVKYFLEQCLCSLQAALTNISAEVLVIDNCSADGSFEYLKLCFPWVTFIQNSTNEGFAKANNKAVRLAKGEFILFLNPDAILAEDTLSQCINFFSNNKHAGAVGVRMVDGSGVFLPESKRAFPAPLVSFYKFTGLSAVFPTSKTFNKYALGFLPQGVVHEVDVLAGAFMMVRKSVLDKTCGFDEQFFMYAEDVDLSYRIQKAGYRNYYLGNITIIHFKGESTTKGSLNYVRLFYRAMLLFVKKHYTGAGAWFMNKGLYAGILLRQMVAALALLFWKKRNNRSRAIFKNIYVVGDATQAEIAIQIIQKNYPENAVKYLKNIKELQLLITEENVVVICTGSGLSYKAAIRLAQTCHNASLFMWCGKNSRSIAGSNNKNTSGFTWY